MSLASAVVGNAVIDAPVYQHSNAQSVAVYVRPHELQIERQVRGSGAIPATVLRINPAGAVVKVSLRGADDAAVQVDLSFERYRELGLQVGESVFISPRRARVFSPEYVI